MVIVDTTVWIDYFGGKVNPEATWLDREATRQRLGLADLNFCEVLQGIHNTAEFKRVREELLTFHIFSTGGVDITISAAESYPMLRQRGYTVRKTVDCWIATFCLLTENQLLHRDHDFDPFEKVLGLQVVHAES